MAVTNNASLIEDHDTAPTYTSVGGGQGAAQDADFVFIGTHGSSRRMDNVTKNGFWFDDGTTYDLSAADTHVKFYMSSVTPGAWTDFWIRLGSATANNYEEHAVGVDFYPNDTGGWVPVWIEVDAGTDTGTPNFAAIQYFGLLVSMNDITSNLKNENTDQLHSAVRPVLTWTGTGGDLDDFVTTDQTNGIGCVTKRDGIYTLYANLQIGSSTQTSFTQNNSTVSSPNATWLPSTSKFMGITFNLGHASTVIDFTGNVFQSADPAGASVRRPDLEATSVLTGGTLDLSGCSLIGLRELALAGSSSTSPSNVTMNDAVIVRLTNPMILNCPLDMRRSAIIEPFVTGGTDDGIIQWNPAVDPDGYLDGVSVDAAVGGGYHAVRFGASGPTSITLRDMSFTGFNAANGQNNSHFDVRRTSGTVTINLVGCTTDAASFSYQTAGATVTLVEDPVTFKVTTRALSDNSALSGVRVLALADDVGPLPYQDSVTITRSGSTASVSHTGHGMSNGDKVLIGGADQDAYNGVQTISNASANAYDYTVSGAPTTPATGTITATGVLLDGTTDVNGDISVTRTYASAQDVTGRARKASGSPYYATSTFSGTISQTAGLTATVLMALDE